MPQRAGGEKPDRGTMMGAGPNPPQARRPAYEQSWAGGGCGLVRLRMRTSGPRPQAAAAKTEGFR